MDTLYSFRRCPYAMRARMALLVSGARFELREVALRDKPAAMIAASSKGTVPVLVLADGRVIDESLAIMRWALARHDPEGWLADADAGLIATFDTRFKHHLDRYKYPERHGTDPAEHRLAGLALLGELEPRLESRTNLCRDARSLTDIAIMPSIRQFASVDRGWFDEQPITRVRDWLDRHVTSSLFGDAMIRLKPWMPGDAPVILWWDG
jgi:glutathione S-transferase